MRFLLKPVLASSLLGVLWITTALPGDQPASAPAAGAETKPPPRKPDIHYIPTPPQVVDKMLELADLKKGDVLYDLGCGDGRVVIAAAKKYGIKGVGVDIDPLRIQESIANAKQAGVTDLVTFRQDDIFQMDLSEANVVALYLSGSMFQRLVPQLETLKPGTRIVAHDYVRVLKPKRGVKFKPTETLTPAEFREFRVTYKDQPAILEFLSDLEAGREHSLFLFVAPVERVDP